MDLIENGDREEANESFDAFGSHKSINYYLSLVGGKSVLVNCLSVD